MLTPILTGQAIITATAMGTFMEMVTVMVMEIITVTAMIIITITDITVMEATLTGVIFHP